MYRYSSDDHSGRAHTIAQIAQAHGLVAATPSELEAAFRSTGGYITVTDSTGRVIAHIQQ